MSLNPIQGPAVEPITLAEARAQCRVDHSAEDALITSLIVVAREQAEQRLSRALITQTWERVLDAFPVAEIELGMPKQLSVVSVKYIDSQGDEQTLDSAAYSLDAETIPGFLHPAYGTSWPATLCAANAVRVRFTAGFGSAAEAVPNSIKQWMLLHVGHWHCNRSASADKKHELLPYVDSLLDSWRAWL